MMIKVKLRVRVSETLVRSIDSEVMEEAAGLQLRFLLGVNSQGLRPGSLEAKCGQAALC